MDEAAFGRYRLIEVIGRGGMGTVYRAHDTVIDREVAIKVLPTELAVEPGYRERFRREAHIAARLAEPHIIPIYDTGEIDGQLYLAMPVVDGVDLTSMLRRDGALEPALAARVIEQLAAALDAAHKRGLVHRDVKPSNALVTPSAFVYLIDFGIAHDASATKLTHTGMTIGTWTYMAPERFSTGTADARGDVYSLTCVLYECLTGLPAFPGDTLEQQVAAHLTAHPPSPSAVNPAVPAAFDLVIALGMAKDPDQRYQTAGELAAGARQALTQPAAPAPTPRSPAFGDGPAAPTPATRPAHSILGDQTLAAAPQVRVDNAGGINQPPTQLANTQLAPPPQPPAHPGAAQPVPKPSGRRTGVLVGAVAGVALLIAGGIFAAVKLSQPHNPAPAPAPTTTPANPAPFTGSYRAEFATPTGLDGEPQEGGTPDTDTWQLRSVCRPAGCVATASRLSGTSDTGTTLVFDQVGESWVAVGLTTKPCNNAPNELWVAITLQPRPDGTLTGEFRGTTANSCREKQTVSFTRTGDVDVNSLPDPAALPPRVVSPAQALRGHYDEKRTFASKNFPAEQADYAVVTDCLRTGDRCMSFFHALSHPDRPLVFSAGNWTLDMGYDVQCSGGGPANHVKQTAQYPLPAPPQDPITLLTGHGQQVQSGGCNALSTNFDETFTRTGD